MLEPRTSLFGHGGLRHGSCVPRAWLLSHLNHILPKYTETLPEHGSLVFTLIKWSALTVPRSGPLCEKTITSHFDLFFSVAVCRFPNTGDDWYVLVGVARDMILNPRSVGGGFIYTYRLIGGGEKLEFVHKVGLTLKVLMGGGVCQMSSCYFLFVGFSFF